MTIKDIAEMTGVSRGTVDRVLHNRGKVAPDKRQAILDAIQKAGFKPNELASAIAFNRSHTIVCLIPSYSPGDIWDITAGGFLKAAESLGSMGVTAKIVTYDQYELSSFTDTCEEILSNPPSGVIVAPMFRSATIRFVHSLEEMDIPYVYIDTKLDDDAYLEFFGLPMYQSGYLGGNILTQRCPSSIKEIVNIRIKRDKNSMSNPLLLRHAGFMDYINEHLPDCKVKEILLDPKDPQQIISTLDREFFPDKDKPRHVIMFNSRVHIVADYIRLRGIENATILGYDMLERNIKALKDGSVSWIIAQHSDVQAGNALRTLAEYLALKRPIAKRDNYSQMDILNKYNCDYYEY